MARSKTKDPTRYKPPAYLSRLLEAHERSGLSLREVAQACDMDHSYVIYLLKGDRRPHRDVIIALGFAYRLDRMEVDEILLLADLPPLGRSVLREYRLRKNSEVDLAAPIFTAVV